MLKWGFSNTLPCLSYTESHCEGFFSDASSVNSESYPWPEPGISSLFICSVAGISCHDCDWLLRHLRATPCWGKGHPPDLDARLSPTLAFPFSHPLLRRYHSFSQSWGVLIAQLLLYSITLHCACHQKTPRASAGILWRTFNSPTLHWVGRQGSILMCLENVYNGPISLLSGK